jgi:AraC-like DNA-binding protein
MDTRPLTFRRQEWAEGGWEMVVGPPAPALRGLVRSYTGYQERSARRLSRTEVPSGEVSLIISFGPSITVSGPAGAGPRVLTSFVAPLHGSRAITAYEGDQHGIQVSFTPPGARMALGVPLGELTDVVTELDDVLGATAARRLVERLWEARSWEARFALLDAVLVRRLLAAPRPHPALVGAWWRLAATQGRLPVASLAQEAGWSRRHLATRFRTEIGLPPKALARILRFQLAAERLRDDARADLARLSLECGYYDQSHLNRDFRAFAGLSPTAFAARLLPGGAGVAGSEEEVTFFQDAGRAAA